MHNILDHWRSDYVERKLMLIYMILLMLLFHVIDDFGLQHITHLNDMKQKLWWINQCAIAKAQGIDTYKYRHDYIVCLFLHAFKWSCMIMLPMFFFYGLTLHPLFIVGLLISNIGIHASVDNLKANHYSLNLIQDQLIHIAQILITALCTYFIF